MGTVFCPHSPSRRRSTPRGSPQPRPMRRHQEKPPEQRGPCQRHQCHPSATRAVPRCPPAAPAGALTLNVCFLLMLSEGCTAATRKLSRGMLPRMFSSFSSGEGANPGVTPTEGPPRQCPPPCRALSHLWDPLPARLLLLPQLCLARKQPPQLLMASPGSCQGGGENSGLTPRSGQHREKHQRAGDMALVALGGVATTSGGGRTFVVEEAAIHQHEPALVPLLHARAGLRERGGERGRERGGEREQRPRGSAGRGGTGWGRTCL